MSEMSLKPCPFRGGEAKLNIITGGKLFSRLTGFYVRCKTCRTSTGVELKEEDVVEKWNARKPMDQIVKQLEAVGNIQFSSYTKPLITVEDAIEIVWKGGAE